jgi:hypothetical protein
VMVIVATPTMRTERVEIFMGILRNWCPDLNEATRALTQALANGHRERVCFLLGSRAPPLPLRGLLWPICQVPVFQNVRRADDRVQTRGYTGVALNPQHGTDLPSPVVQPLSDAPSTTSLRRVLRRARDGVALNVDEAAIAMTARGDDLVDLCASAARVRDAGLTSSSRRGANGRLPVS